jgi:hypothetical protein
LSSTFRKKPSPTATRPTGGYFTDDTLAEACSINLSPIRKKNSTRPDSAPVHYLRAVYLRAVYRKRIETTFSPIGRLMPRSIHATTAEGFELEVFLSSRSSCSCSPLASTGSSRSQGGLDKETARLRGRRAVVSCHHQQLST